MSYDTNFFTTLELHDLEKVAARIRLDESEPLHGGYFLDYVEEADADWISIIQNEYAFMPKTMFILQLGNHSAVDQWPLHELIQRIKSYFPKGEVLALENGDTPV